MAKPQSSFRRINNFFHLWLGLASGLIVLVVCLTACLWVFQEEIGNLLYPPIRLQEPRDSLVPPSRLLAVADSLYPGKPIRFVRYVKQHATEIGLNTWSDHPFTLRVHPYTGQSLGEAASRQKMDGFFEWVLHGHRALWLPWDIGRPVVNYATLIFVFELITGLVWWYPKKWTRATREKSFKIKWDAKWKRLNIDLHNVLGFYALLILLALSCTGMVYGIEWYSRGLYRITTGQEQEAPWPKLQSDTVRAAVGKPLSGAMDSAFNHVIHLLPGCESYEVRYPDTASAHSTLEIYARPNSGRYYDAVNYAFDRYTLDRLPHHELYGRVLSENSFGQKLRRMNYDIHVGSVLGLPGKTLAFFASLVGATLPITGFIIWYNRKWGKKKKSR